MSKSSIPEKVIEYTFYAVIFLVPIIFLPITSELFEFNKIILVYLGTSVIITAWLFKSVAEKKFSFNRTPLDIPIALFLIANIASTIFSIDPHTSIFGYYGRWNGGLLSTLAYITLFYACVTFFDRQKLLNLIKILLLSSFVVAVYAILQHPTPLFHRADGSFRGIDAGYWQQDAEARAFSTLGHPNWLAAFMAMVIPFAFAFLLLVKTWWEKGIFAILLVAYFLAFTFAYSRGGSLGLIATIFTLIVGFAIIYRQQIKSFISKPKLTRLITHLRFPNSGLFILAVIISWAAVVFFFGNALTLRGVNLEAIQAEGDTQLAAAGPETGRIRLIVWQGALDIFKKYPILGSGVETFAYSYYQFRPPEHNYTSEWSFLYNKAHNEFANFLATTGLFGLVTYLIFLIALVFLVLKHLCLKNDIGDKILIVSALSGFIGYHVQNFFGFSVVPIALLFFLAPGIFLILAGDRYLKSLAVSLDFLKKPLFDLAAKSIAFTLGSLLVIVVSIMWLADFYYSQALSSSSYGQSYRNLKTSVSLRPDEPLYKAHLGWITMHVALEESGEKKKEKIAESFTYLNKSTSASPQNISLWRIRLQSVYKLAQDQEEYTSQVIDTARVVADLAPTEAEIQYTLGSMYVFASDYTKAQKQLEKVTSMKFNYLDAWKLLFQVDAKLKDTPAQKEHFNSFKKHFPEESQDKEFQIKYELL